MILTSMALCPKATLFLMPVVLTLAHNSTEVSLFTYNDLDPEDVVSDLWATPRTALEEACGVHGVSQKDAVPLYLLITHIVWFMKGCHANK